MFKAETPRLHLLTLLQSSLILASPVLMMAPAKSLPTPSAGDLLSKDESATDTVGDEPHLEIDPSRTLPATRSTLTLSDNASAVSSAINLDPKLIEASPVLRRWLQQVPNVLEDIKRDPSFRTRVRLGYSQFPSTDDAGGWNIGVEDALIGQTGLTVSADYQATFNGKREAWGADLRYYVRPLGSYVNVAPVVGYRHLETTRYSTDGANLGLRLLVVPSRTGAADISLTQSWVSPGSDNEVGLTTLSVGYAVTRHLRLSTDIQKQNAPQRKDSRVGISLEWMF